jgi:hypothetical protein
MDLREWDREHELWVTEKVASEIYRTQRIDYKVHKPKNNNEEDAILVDTSGKTPPGRSRLLALQSTRRLFAAIARTPSRLKTR